MNTELGSKWHGFMKVVLIINGIIGMLLGIITMFGGTWFLYTDYSASEIYRFFPGFQILDVIYGIITCLIAIAHFYVYSKLKNLKTGAPKMLFILYIVECAVGLIYALILSAGLGGSVVNWTGIIGSAATASINKAYYDKREAWFVN